jgi:hypothetical protein
MRAYCAVIQDAFREALASRVLWVLLVLITLLLALLAPLGYRQQITRGLSEGSVRDMPHFIEYVRDQARKPEPSLRSESWPCSTNLCGATYWRSKCPARARWAAR